MTSAIQTNQLTKTYGKQRGVAELNLDVQAGEVFGYLGPNGAGKTTTIRMLLDMIRPTGGSATVLGLDAQKDSVAIHRRVTYLPGELVLYDTLTGRELCEYFANLRGGVDWSYVTRIANQLGLDMKRPIRTLSKGNKQKVGLVQALMNRSELLILDEPTSGLDPLVQQEFYALVKEAHDEGRTVFLSSHVLAEVEHVCDRVAIIRTGELVLVDTMKALKARALRTLEITFAAPVVAEEFAQLPSVREVRVHENSLHCTVEGSVDELIKAAARHSVQNIINHEGDLEDVFLSYYEVNHAQ